MPLSTEHSDPPPATILDPTKQNHPSEVNTFSDKNAENLLPGDVPCKKGSKFFREKENDIGQKLRAT